jgi:hypothetical protein
MDITELFIELNHSLVSLVYIIVNSYGLNVFNTLMLIRVWYMMLVSRETNGIRHVKIGFFVNDFLQ